jgi:D-xylose transport system permease protein
MSEAATDASPIGGTPGAPEARRGAGLRSSLGQFDWSTYGLVAAVALIWLVFDIGTGGVFLTGRNLTLLLVQAVILGIAACGMVFIMVAGHIDLSIGSAVGLTATFAAFLQSEVGLGALWSIGLALVLGLVIGVWQGLWVSYLRIPAFIVTLAGMMLIRGVTYILSNGQTFSVTSTGFQQISGGSLGRTPSLVLIIVVAAVSIFGVARSAIAAREDNGGRLKARQFAGVIPVLIMLGLVGYIAEGYQGIPYSVLVVAVLAALLSFIGNNTKHGRRVYAIGGDLEAAKRAGIKVRRYVFVLFVVMGLIYGLDGVVLASRLDGAPPDPALFLELNAITAAIIGGTSLFGGVGRVPGALLGAVLLTSLANGMELMNLSTYYQFVVEGVVLLLAVLLDLTLKSRRET